MPLDSRRSRAHPTHSWPGDAPRRLAAVVAVAAAILLGVPCAADTVVECSDATIAAGGVGTVQVRLRAENVAIAGVQNDLHFSGGMRVLGDLHCTVNPAIGKEGTAFALQPWNSGPGDCGWLRAVVISLRSIEPIPDGALLYTCEVGVARNVRPGPYPVRVVNADGATPQGGEVPIRGVDCTVHVSTSAAPAVPPVPAPTATARAAHHAPPRRVTWQPTPTATRRADDGGAGRALMRDAADGASGGCQLAVPGAADGGALVVLIVAGGLALIRARTGFRG